MCCGETRGPGEHPPLREAWAAPLVCGTLSCHRCAVVTQAGCVQPGQASAHPWVVSRTVRPYSQPGGFRDGGWWACAHQRPLGLTLRPRPQSSAACLRTAPFSDLGGQHVRVRLASSAGLRPLHAAVSGLGRARERQRRARQAPQPNGCLSPCQLLSTLVLGP